MDVKPEISILWIAEWNVQGFHSFHLFIFNLWEVLSFKDRTSCRVWWKLIHSRYPQWVISRVLFFVVGVFPCLLWKGEGGLQHHSYQLFPELSLEFSEAPSRSPCSPPSIGCSDGALSERTLLTPCYTTAPSHLTLPLSRLTPRLSQSVPLTLFSFLIAIITTWHTFRFIYVHFSWTCSLKQELSSLSSHQCLDQTWTFSKCLWHWSGMRRVKFTCFLLTTVAQSSVLDKLGSNQRR